MLVGVGGTEGTIGMQGDEEQNSEWDRSYPPPLPPRPRPSQTHPNGQAKSRRARRLDVAAAVLAMLLVLAVIAFLTTLLTSVAGPIIVQDLTTTPTTAPSVATYEAELTPTSTDWATYQNSDVGFQMDLPGVIGSFHAYFINDFSGKGSDFYYNGAPLSSPLQKREAPLWVKVLYSTKITDYNICPQGGTPVALGSGKAHIPAWERVEGRIVALNLVLNGNAIEIDLDTRDNAQPALPAYADIWQHMLASFVPVSGAQPRATHPCG